MKKRIVGFTLFLVLFSFLNCRAIRLPLPPSVVDNSQPATQQTHSQSAAQAHKRPPQQHKSGFLAMLPGVIQSNRNAPNVKLPPKVSNKLPIPAKLNKASRKVVSKKFAQRDLREAAFIEMSRDLLPMSSQQIGRLHALFNESQRAMEQEAGVPALPTSSTTLIRLAPGSTPPIVRLGSGFVSSLVFLDSSGAPWPIQSYDIGDPKAYSVQWDKKSNILLVQASSLYKRANLAVLLRGLNTPIMVTLLSGQKAIDYRMDLRVPGLGPNATTAGLGVPSGASSELIKVLDGIPPEGGKSLQIEGGAATAWLAHEQLYLRTSMTIISPGWVSMIAGPDNSIRAYKLPNASLLLALYDGHIVKLHVKGF